MSDGIHIVCPHCDSVNRIPGDKPPLEARCGRCHNTLFTGQPVSLTGPRLQKHIERSDIPVLVDVWAEWCGPCRMMAPIFEQAARELEPRVRLVKLNSDQEREFAAQAGIRGIPTLILYHRGKERARTSGAMDLRSLIGWVQSRLG